MEKRLEQVLNGEEENYILPFVWQHGESEEKLRKMMEEVHGCGIGAVCIESRPHPDFAGAGWWRDMDIIMDEARRRDMRVWVLDDAHFPTGWCNGKIEEHSLYSKRYLDHYTIDAAGPQKGTSFFLALEEGEVLEGVIAAKRVGNRTGKLTAAVDLTDRVSDKTLYWDIPEGYWNVVVIKSTFNGTGRKNYINTIDAASVRFFLDTVYEPHWEHYKEVFGQTFAGFFSDEPELGNCVGEYGHHAVIGQPDMRLPWGKELSERIRTLWGRDTAVRLAALWNETDELTPCVRYEYMDLVTDLYGTNFCGQIGGWCERHGVEYIGHVIEDNGTHAHLGLGTGHFFKALWGQHMSGIDVVLQQIRPGYDDKNFYHIGGRGTYNGTFFHYGLAKLGVSLGHLDPVKKGRTMCEIYGAYGWSEGLTLMKWLTDHMLVRGVNWFVPHAFTGADFPDPDCPPHFYAWGNNPQFPWFSSLCRYMNRVSHLINAGQHIAQVALLYTAEMEWMGAYQPFEEVGQALARHQIDYEVIPIGLLNTCAIEKRMLKAGAEHFRVLVIPDCEYIPEELGKWILKAVEALFPVVFAGRIPKLVHSGLYQADSFYGWKAMETQGAAVDRESNDNPDHAWERLREREQEHKPTGSGETVVYESETGKITRLIERLRYLGCSDIVCHPEAPSLRYYHYRQPGGDLYLFFNEHPAAGLLTSVTVDALKGKDKVCCWYQAFDNRMEPVKLKPDGGVELQLASGQASILYVSEDTKQLPVFHEPIWGRCLTLDEEWYIRLKGFDEAEYGSGSRERLHDITGIGRNESFAGTIRYDVEFDWAPENDGRTLEIDFGQVYETLEVWLNGEKKAVRIAPPYTCRLERAVRGRNQLTVYVANTLVHRFRDSFSATMPVERSGMLGPVTVKGFWEDMD